MNATFERLHDAEVRISKNQ